MTPDERLRTIANWHTPAADTDRCGECGELAPCDTLRMADGTYPDTRQRWNIGGVLGGDQRWHTSGVLGGDGTGSYRLTYDSHTDSVTPRCPECGHWNITGSYHSHGPCAAIVRVNANQERTCGCTYNAVTGRRP